MFNKNILVANMRFLLCFGMYCVFAGLLNVFLCYMLSAVLHELGHLLVAKKLGYKMLQIRIMPYGAELCGELDEFLYVDDVKIFEFIRNLI